MRFSIIEVTMSIRIKKSYLKKIEEYNLKVYKPLKLLPLSSLYPSILLSFRAAAVEYLGGRISFELV